MSKSVFDMLFEMVRTRKPVPGESGVQRISWAYGQVAVDHPSFDLALLREMAEQAVCAESDAVPTRYALVPRRPDAGHRVRGGLGGQRASW